MKCHRCGDTMILKKFYDYGGYDWRWKCPRCGEMRDQMGTDNRHVERVGQWRKSQRKEIAVIQG
jgi:uncharacterized C2H2 Zn-finger protein